MHLEIALKFGIILATEVLKIQEGSLSKEQIIKNAILLLNIEHGINIINYEELNFEKTN